MNIFFSQNLYLTSFFFLPFKFFKYKLTIRLSVKTINGYKAIARKGKTAQEVFVSTDLSKDELKKIIESYNI